MLKICVCEFLGSILNPNLSAQTRNQNFGDEGFTSQVFTTSGRVQAGLFKPQNILSLVTK